MWLTQHADSETTFSGNGWPHTEECIGSKRGVAHSKNLLELSADDLHSECVNLKQHIN